MDLAGSNALEVETATSPVVALNSETCAKLVNLPKPKVSQKRKGTT